MCSSDLGDALTTLINVWGVDLNGGDGVPRSLGTVVDSAFRYLSTQATGSGPLTKDDIEIAFQPGNSMHSFFSRLVIDQATFNAIKKRMIDNAS